MSYPPVTVFMCYAGYRLIVAFRHVCQFTTSSGVSLFCFTILFTSLSNFFSGLSLLSLPSGDQVSIRLDRLLSPIRNMMSTLWRTALFWIVTKWEVLISYWRFGTLYRYHLQGWTLKMGQIGRPETSVRNYYHTLRNNSEERSAHLPRCGRSKSRYVLYMLLYCTVLYCTVLYMLL